MLQPVIVGLVLISCTCAENPGVQVILTDKGLQYGKHLGAGWIQEKLPLVTFPDINGRLLGSIYYTLSGVTITKCDLPEPSVEFYQEVNGVKTSVSGLSVAVTGRWTTQFGLIHDGGSFNLALFNMDVTSEVALGKDDGGHLSVTSVHCNTRLQDVNMQFYGGASWMFNPLVDYFKGHIKSKIEAAICPAVDEYIANLEYHLQAMKVSFDVDENVTFDLPLISIPIVNASSMNLGLKGEFYSVRPRIDPPFEAQPFTVEKQPGYMLSVGLSEFTLNSASFALHSAGLLQTIITDSMIPPNIPVHLNTSWMGPYVPQLPKMFPGLLMVLQIYAREVPMFSFQSGVVKLPIEGAVKAFAIQPNGTQIPLFKLHVVSTYYFTLALASSEVGTFQPRVYLSVSAELGKGAVLPRMKNAQLVNTVLGMEKGFVAIASDVQVLLAGVN
uniref:Bactericidal permeability-increasing protein n=2 Tax=Gasterosteus aculeatus aculeatus TaxID=481459 RepID=G3NSE0_GASAC